MNDACSLACNHDDRRIPRATTTIANDGLKWRVCDVCARLWDNASVKAVFRALTTKVEPRPVDMSDAASVAAEETKP